MSFEHDYLFKFLIIGDSCVGKSCLLMRFADDNFTETFTTTVGVDFSVRTIELDDKIIKLQVWDCAGQERFRSIVTSYYRGAHGIILAYSVADKKTFDNIKFWHDDCKKQCGENINFILIGTKSDLEKKREVLYSQGVELGKELGAKFVETSAKKDIGVTQVFHELTKLTIDTFISHKLNKNVTSVKLTKLKKHSCC
jgi:small GTP-binding protein